MGEWDDSLEEIDQEQPQRICRLEEREKKRQMRRRRQKIKRLIVLAVVAAGIIAVIAVIINIVIKQEKRNQEDTQQTETEISQEAIQRIPEDNPAPEVGIGWNYPNEDGWIVAGGVNILHGFTAEENEQTVVEEALEYQSEYAVLIDESTNTILAEKDADVIISPASMTKIMTILVAAEHVTDLDEEVTITREVTDYSYINDCSAVGFLDEENVTVRDLFYGTILPSGGDAAYALAIYVAGSHEVFVDMMNDKLEELGLSETAHFTNCVGLYDEDHYCTVTDMAMILKAAVENDWCREVLSLHTYTTSTTEQHPEGITISNWFLRSIEEYDTGGEVLCAKTGYVNESRYCAASYFISDEGKPYICVTATAPKKRAAIEEHVALYSKYAH